MAHLFTKDEIDDVCERYLKIHFNEEESAKIKAFQIRDDDIFLLGNQKSGTTWMQEMVWLIANNCNYDESKVFIDERFPVLEIAAYNFPQQYIHLQALKCHSNAVEYINNMKSPRFIKSHLPIDMLPEQLLSGATGAKIIYVARNVKDVCLSSYYHLKNLSTLFDGPFDDYYKLFIVGYVMSNNYWENLLYFWNNRHRENILFIKYEEMIDDLSQTIRKVVRFLNKSISLDEEEKLKKWLSIESMKNNSAINHENIYYKSGFIRVGKVGEHKKEMSPEIIEKFDTWINESLKGSDYKM